MSEMFIAIGNFEIIISAFRYRYKMNRQILIPKNIKKESFDSR